LVILFTHGHVYVFKHVFHCFLKIFLESGLVESWCFRTVLRLRSTVSSATIASESIPSSSVCSLSVIFPRVMSITTMRSMMMSWSLSLESSSERRSASIDVPVCLSLRVLVLVNNRKDSSRSLHWGVDFQKSIWMLFSFLTHGAVVKVLSDTAFKSWSDDRTNSTAVTLDVHVLYRSVVIV
jgi:hypothetical protein